MTDTGPLTFTADLRGHLKAAGQFEEARALQNDPMALELFLRGPGKHSAIPQEVFDYTLHVMAALVGWTEFARLLFEGEEEHAAFLASHRAAPPDSPSEPNGP